MTEWSVLVTVVQPPSQAPITDAQTAILLDHLPGDDKWVQYPPASGRGHGFETRFWFPGDDAASAGADAIERYGEAIGLAGLDGIDIVFVHIASAEDRLTEYTVGLERRRGSPDEARQWSHMLRSVAGPRAAERSFSRETLMSLLERLGSESSGFARDGLVEVRFWVVADDGVEASARGSAAFREAMAALGRGDWTTVRDHATTVAEAARVAYLGVDSRLSQDGLDRGPVVIHR